MSVSEWNRLQLKARQLEVVRQVIADHLAGHPSPETERLADSLARAGFTVPVLYCLGVTRDGDDCGRRLHHEGECRWQ